MARLEIDFVALRASDPFGPFNTGQGSRPQEDKGEKPLAITAPAYLLQGIVWDENDPKAILVKSRIFHEPGNMKIGETVIVRRGDSVDYGKIVDISDKYVIITTYNKKFKLKSNLWEEIE